MAEERRSQIVSLVPEGEIASLCQHPFDALKAPTLPPKCKKIGRQVRRTPIQERRLGCCPRLDPVEPFGDTRAFALPHRRHAEHVEPVDVGRHRDVGKREARPASQDRVARAFSILPR